jgi:UDP-N-acetylglucosamine--N-acetylmuramyl-(pentapeptide) pyrophosphoryl-undecaprenol N-acetylglucosamine transferase
MLRIAYFVHGRGKGHAIRTRAVLGGLRKRDEVRLFCAGEAWDALNDVPCAEPLLPCMPGRGMARSFRLRFRGDRQRLRRWSPDLVVSDGDGPSVNAARSLGIPVVAVGHGLIFHHTHLNASLPLHRHIREVLNVTSSSWPAASRVAVHFAPIRPRTPGTYVARPDLRTKIQPAATREDFLLAYFRDGNGTAALGQLTSRGHRVVLFGEPREVPKGVELRAANEQAFADALGRCRAVVGSAGNHLPAECAMLGIPMLALHRGDDGEHQMNGHLVEAAGIGIASSFEQVTPSLVRRFEAELDKPRDELAARTCAMPPASEVVPRAIEELCRHRARRAAWKTRTA